VKWIRKKRWYWKPDKPKRLSRQTFFWKAYEHYKQHACLSRRMREGDRVTWPEKPSPLLGVVRRTISSRKDYWTAPVAAVRVVVDRKCVLLSCLTRRHPRFTGDMNSDMNQPRAISFRPHTTSFRAPANILQTRSARSGGAAVTGVKKTSGHWRQLLISSVCRRRLCPSLTDWQRHGVHQPATDWHFRTIPYRPYIFIGGTTFKNANK